MDLRAAHNYNCNGIDLVFSYQTNQGNCLCYRILVESSPLNYQTAIDKLQVEQLITFLQSSLEENTDTDVWNEQRGVSIPVDKDRTDD